MTRLKNSIVIFLVVCSASAQDAYDFDHSLKFGQYLYNTKQFDLAAQEFERAVFYEPYDSISNFLLFKSYTLLNNKTQALQSYSRYTNDSTLSQMPNNYATLYVQLLLKNEDYQESQDFIQNNCCLSQKHIYLTCCYLTQKQWQKAWESSQYLSPHISPLLELVDKSRNIKYKSPILGTIFSAIIPGSGKLYAKDWQDALIGFLMTSASGFLAYRSYNEYGIKSPYTWITGTLALGYYGGNIYGAYNTVKKYNHKKEDLIVNETKRYISDY